MIVGTFDGVHRGHQRLLHRARQHADRRGLPLVAVTFDPPLGPVPGTLGPPAVLTGASTGAEPLAQHGVDAVCVLTPPRTLSPCPAGASPTGSWSTDCLRR